MHRTIHSLIGYHLEGTDGELGKVEEFYFDDQTWTIQYLVVKTGSWLLGRKVLISPQALIKGPARAGAFPVNLTMEQIRHSPDIDTDQPVSRQEAMKLHLYYPWQNYWATDFYDSGVLGGVTPVPGVISPRADDQAEIDLHLRSTGAISGYHIETMDGQVGHLRDFVVDDATWQIEYLVVEIAEWLNGKHVLIPCKHIKEIQWKTARVLTDMTGYALKHSPAFEESSFSYPETIDTVFDNNLPGR